MYNTEKNAIESQILITKQLAKITFLIVITINTQQGWYSCSYRCTAVPALLNLTPELGCRKKVIELRCFQTLPWPEVNTV